MARGKAAGLYVEQKIIKTGKLEDLTTEQLEDKMKNIMKEYSSIINVTPEPEEIKENTQKPKRIQKPTKQKPKTTEKDTEEPVEKDLSKVN